MYWRITTAKLRLPWWMAMAKVVERPDVDGGHFSLVVDLEDGRYQWIVEAPKEARLALRMLPGVLRVEPVPDLMGGPGELAA